MNMPKSRVRPKTRWKTKIPDVRIAILPAFTTRPNPVVTTNMVFASLFAPGAVCALERETGRTLWVRELDAHASSAVLAHSHVLYATSCRTLYALDPKTGNTIWKFSPQPKEGEWIYSQPVVSDGRVFIGDRSGNFNCLDSQTGRRLWRRQLSRGCNNQVNSTPVVARDKIIAANNEGAVVCYATATGKTLWRQKIDGGCINELLRARDKVIVAGASLYEINSQTGVVERRHNYPKKRIASVAISGSRIAAVLGTDFHSDPSAWDQSSAFDSELVVMVRGRELTKTVLSGPRTVRICDETGFLYAAGQTQISAVDLSDGSVVMVRNGAFGLPSYSNGVLYCL